MWPNLCVRNLLVESRYPDASTVWRRRVRPLDHGGDWKRDKDPRSSILLLKIKWGLLNPPCASCDLRQVNRFSHYQGH